MLPRPLPEGQAVIDGHQLPLLRNGVVEPDVIAAVRAELLLLEEGADAVRVPLYSVSKGEAGVLGHSGKGRHHPTWTLLLATRLALSMIFSSNERRKLAQVRAFVLELAQTAKKVYLSRSFKYLQAIPIPGLGR